MEPRVEIERLRGELALLREEFRTVSSLGMRLSSALDPAALLPTIVTEARALTRSEAGSLYVRRDDRLVFEVAQNDALVEDRDGNVDDLPKIELAIDGSSLAGLAASERRVLNIADAREHDAHSRSAKDSFGYEVVSMLVVPMIDHRGEVLGVLQLMNARDAKGRIAPYSERQDWLCEVLAAHAATAMEIARLYTELHDVFDSLVRYSTAAVDARDPCTAGHSSRVGAYAVQVGREMACFSSDELREIRFAGIFHDIGKIGVRECILTKSNKIPPEGMAIIEARFLAACEALVGGAAPGAEADAAKGAAASLLADLEFLERVVVPAWMSDEDLARVASIGAYRWRDFRGTKHALLSADDVERLCVRKGNLTDAERREIESHASLSRSFLEQIPFSKDLARVPAFAGAHHEKLDGSGYPRGLKGDEIPVQTRILTIVDVFDALTAEDRPYKKAMSPERALAIIEHEAAGGAFDVSIVAVLRRLVERGRFVPKGHRPVADAPEAPFDAAKEAWR